MGKLHLLALFMLNVLNHHRFILNLFVRVLLFDMIVKPWISASFNEFAAPLSFFGSSQLDLCGVYIL